jgi:hypothetical protein
VCACVGVRVSVGVGLTFTVTEASRVASEECTGGEDAL